MDVKLVLLASLFNVVACMFVVVAAAGAVGAGEAGPAAVESRARGSLWFKGL